MKRRLRILVVFLLAGALAASDYSYGQCAYDITIVAGPDCGGLGSPTLGRGINENAQVVGQYSNEAFLWDGGPGVFTLMRPAGVGGAGAWDLNDNAIVGAMSVTGVGERAFLYQEGQFIDLGTLPGGTFSKGRAINSSGQIVGVWGNGVVGDPALAAFIWQDGVMTDLNAELGTPNSEAHGINDAGQVVGWMGDGFVNGAEAFIWHDGQVTPLGHVPDGYFSSGQAINEFGSVAGYAYTGESPNTTTRTVLWEQGEVVDIGLLPGFERSGAFDINDRGQIVGRAWGVDGNPNIEACFIWQNGMMTDLNDLIPPNTGVEITWATAINNQGQITGVADDVSGNVCAFLLTPIDQPLGDLDGDCNVGITDFLMLLSLWGPCPAPCPPSCVGDLDDDCSVGITDFLILLTNWG